MLSLLFSIFCYLNKAWRIVHFIVVSLLFLSGLGYSQLCQEPIEFSDLNLEKAVKTTLGKLLDQPVSCQELVNLRSLYADESAIVSLEGLEKATNLEVLSLNNNDINDLTPLENSTKLKMLYLSHNHIKNITFLKNLGELQVLYLDNNLVERIGVLRKLSQLQTLNLSGNRLKDIAVLNEIDLTANTTIFVFDNCLDLVEQEVYFDVLKEKQIVIHYEPQKDCVAKKRVEVSSSEVILCEEVKTDPEMWVLQGKEGWFFSVPDLSIPGSLDPAKSYLSRFAKTLEEHGTQLIIVMPPRRGMVYDMYFNPTDDRFRQYSTEAARNAYEQALMVIQEAGIAAPDILALMLERRQQEQLYFKTDHHWTFAGARLAASAVAQIIKNSEGYKILEKTPYKNLEQSTDVPFEGGWSRQIENVCRTAISTELTSKFSTEGLEDSASLFGDVTWPEVVLVGTSYSKAEREPGYNFDGFLKEALGLDVLNEAVTAGGPFTAIQNYLQSDGYLQHPPKYLIWEFLTPNEGSSMASPVYYRQIIPSISGVCDDSEIIEISEGNLTGLRTNLLNLLNKAQSIKGSDYFLYLELSNLTLVDFEISFQYQDDSVDSVPISRSTRVINTGTFFLELSADSSYLEMVNLTLPEVAQSTFKARICKNRS
jgi:alginate biosynthesis protein AlgX